jgi:hypothetical protein
MTIEPRAGIVTLDADGLELRPGALGVGERRELLAIVAPEGHTARNLLELRPALRPALARLGIDALATEVLGAPAFAINALHFDKTPGANWKVPGHQDLMMPVERAVDEPGFTGWCEKGGVVHVEPPAAVLAGLIALRIHFDDCPASNGALAVVPGSHRHGKLGDAALAALPREAYVPCAARSGDILLCRPLLVHRSSPSELPGHRRVLHVVYASADPGSVVRWRRA